MSPVEGRKAEWKREEFKFSFIDNYIFLIIANWKNK